jgi:hypothetical protein
LPIYATALGIGAVRDRDRNLRVVLAVTGNATAPPLDQPSRNAYQQAIAAAAARTIDCGEAHR